MYKVVADDVMIYHKRGMFRGRKFRVFANSDTIAKVLSIVLSNAKLSLRGTFTVKDSLR